MHLAFVEKNKYNAIRLPFTQSIHTYYIYICYIKRWTQIKVVFFPNTFFGVKILLFFWLWFFFFTAIDVRMGLNWKPNSRIQNVKACLIYEIHYSRKIAKLKEWNMAHQPYEDLMTKYELKSYLSRKCGEAFNTDECAYISNLLERLSDAKK